MQRAGSPLPSGAPPPPCTRAPTRRCSSLVQPCSSSRMGRSISASRIDGGPICPARIGGIRTDRIPALTFGTTTRLCTSRTKMPRPTPRGPASDCRPKPSGNGQLGEARSRDASSQVTRDPTRTYGSVSSHGTRHRCRVQRRSVSTESTASDWQTCWATPGNGPRPGSIIVMTRRPNHAAGRNDSTRPLRRLRCGSPRAVRFFAARTIARGTVRQRGWASRSTPRRVISDSGARADLARSFP